MSKSSFTIWMLLLLLIAITLIPYALSILNEILIPGDGQFWAMEPIYVWFVAGVVGALVLKVCLREKSHFLETFSHELTHVIMALLLREKVVAFHVEDTGDGSVYTTQRSGWSMPLIALAPYCLPVFTYLLLAVRCAVTTEALWLVDIIIGMTCGFHIICFRSQLCPKQPDVRQFPLLFSYAYILLSWIMNAVIILVAFYPSMNGRDSMWGYGVFSSVLRLGEECWQYLHEYLLLIGTLILG